MRVHWTSTAWVCAWLVIAGCSGAAHKYDAVVTGKVTIDGELAHSGTITFHPADEGPPALSQIFSDGSYSLRTGQGDLRKVDGGTIASGEYLVTVSINAPPVERESAEKGGPPMPGPLLIHSKYLTKETTDLRYTVVPGSQVINLELERAEPQSADAGEDDDAESDASELEAVDPDATEPDVTSESPNP